MHALLVSTGIAGDALPMIHWGRVLKSRGHEVTVLGNGAYRHAAERFGLPHVDLITPQEHERRNVRRTRSRREALRSGIDNMVADLGAEYRQIAERVVPGETVVAAHGLCLGARVAQEQLGVPTATVHISPSQLRSRYDRVAWPPRIPGFLIPGMLRFYYRILGRRLLPELNRVRGEAGLSDLESPLPEWWNSPDRVIGFFPRWFAPPQPDWPAQTEPVGFALHAVDDTEPLDGELERFLDAGDPPLVFSYTSGVESAPRFFTTAVELARSTGRRAVLLAPDAMMLDQRLPDSVKRFVRAPHLRLFPRCAAAVHHGGIGTLAAAVSAGIPQLIVPYMLDQPEMGRRVERLGIGASIVPRKFDVGTAAPVLNRLLASEGVRTACESRRRECADQRGFERASDLLEELQAERREPSTVAGREKGRVER